MRTERVKTAVLCGIGLFAFVGTHAPAQEWSWDRQENKSFALKHGEQIVWQFNYAADQAKPYFHPVALPGGPVVTWNRPPDHVWHHGLWFCWKYINGVNYWEPDKTGMPPGKTEWKNVMASPLSDHSARIAMDLTYRPRDGKPLMTEKRTVVVSAPDKNGQFHMDWTCEFTAGDEDVKLDRTPLQGEPGGQAWGGYAGLSLRLAKGLAERNAVSTNGPVKFNAQSRHRSKATGMEYDGVLDGREVGVAMLDHPENLNHPSPWYVIRSEPMSFFTPAVICYGPHTLKANQTMTLHYRVIVHPGRWNAEKLEDEYQRFVADSKEK